MLSLTTQDYLEKMGQVANGLFAIRHTDELLLLPLGVALLQLLAYYVALMRDYGIDKLRNLAKSMTAE